MDQDTSRLTFQLSPEAHHIVTKLANIGSCRRALLALNYYWHSVPIYQEDVEPRAVLEKSFPKALIRIG